MLITGRSSAKARRQLREKKTLRKPTSAEKTQDKGISKSQSVLPNNPRRSQARRIKELFMSGHGPAASYLDLVGRTESQIGQQ
jgi:hypothetical protein